MKEKEKESASRYFGQGLSGPSLEPLDEGRGLFIRSHSRRRNWRHGIVRYPKLMRVRTRLETGKKLCALST